MSCKLAPVTTEVAGMVLRPALLRTRAQVWPHAGGYLCVQLCRIWPTLRTRHFLVVGWVGYGNLTRFVLTERQK